MARFEVTLKSISVDLPKALIAKGAESKTVVNSSDEYMAIKKAVWDGFDGCAWRSIDRHSDGSRIIEIISGHAIYGRAYAYAEQVARDDE